jgi:hypothetical protein
VDIKKWNFCGIRIFYLNDANLVVEIGKVHEKEFSNSVNVINNLLELKSLPAITEEEVSRLLEHIPYYTTDEECSKIISQFSPAYID